MNDNVSAVQYIQASINMNECALFLWEGRSYYRDARGVPDDEQSTALRLAVGLPSPERLSGELRESGTTHLLLSKPDANWFIAFYDPRGLRCLLLTYLNDTFFPACGELMYVHQGMEVYEITCQ